MVSTPFGDATTVVTFGGSGGTDHTLNRIAGPDMGSTYLESTSSTETQAKVAHSTSGTRNRHYVEYKHTAFAGGLYDEDETVQVSVVILAPKHPNTVVIDDLVQAATDHLGSTNIAKLLAYVS